MSTEPRFLNPAKPNSSSHILRLDESPPPTFAANAGPEAGNVNCQVLELPCTCAHACLILFGGVAFCVAGVGFGAREMHFVWQVSVAIPCFSKVAAGGLCE